MTKKEEVIKTLEESKEKCSSPPSEEVMERLEEIVEKILGEDD